jgi:WD40 repeat protein
LFCIGGGEPVNPLEIPEKFLTQIARDKRVSEGELEALKLALSKRKSKDIAKQLDISEAAARKRLGEVYKKFGIKGKGPGKLASLEAALGARLVDYDYDLAGVVATGLINHQIDGVDKRALEGVSSLGVSSLGVSSLGVSSLGVSSLIVAETMTGQRSAGLTQAAIQSKAASGVGDRTYKTLYVWDDAPELSAFQGRGELLEDLETWMIEPTCAPKLLALCGIGGIGKSYLARKLVENVGDRFQKVLWLSLDQSKPAEELLRSLKTKLQTQQSTLPLRRSKWAEAGPASAEAIVNRQSVRRSEAESCDLLVRQIAALIVQQSALIVLDGFDSIFKSYSSADTSNQNAAPTFDVTRGQQASLYKEGFEACGKLLTALKNCKNCEGISQASCVLLTSREKPRELVSFSADDAHGKLHLLEGLAHSEAQTLLKAFHLSGAPKDYRDFIDRYCGHPMALRLAANTVRDVFHGRIRDFLEQKISVFDDLRSLLKKQFSRLPPTEKEVMYWLAINHQPCTLADLKEDIVAEDHKSNVLYTLRSLQQRSLIQVDRHGRLCSFRLHPIVAGYVLERFIRAVFQDLMRHQLQLFNEHALMKADAEDEIREFQLKNIVQPILERLRNYCKSLHAVDEYLSDRLNEFRDNNPYRLGYAGGNFVNLLVQLSRGQILSGKNFSQMTIWQAYLQRVQLREVSFNQCELDRSVFTETLSDVMAIAFSQSQQPSQQLSGKTFRQPFLAAGDANGVVHLWPTQASKTSSQKCAEWAAHSSWVRAMAFVPNQSLLVTGGDDNWLRLWQLPANSLSGLSQPNQVWQQSAYDWVHTVAVSADGSLIASGGDDKITLYNTRNGRLISRFADQTAAQSPPQVVVPADTLATATEIKTVQKNRIRTLAFSPDGGWLASSGDDCVVRIWPLAALLQANGVQPVPMRLSDHSAMVHTLCFSPDSRWLISGGADKTLRVWDVTSGTLKKTLDRPGDQVRSLAISPNGLLASGGDDCQVMLWDLNKLEHIQDIPTGQSRIWSVAFQQQGNKLLLSAGGDKQSLMLWQIDPHTTQSHIAETENSHIAATTHQFNPTSDTPVLDCPISDNRVSDNPAPTLTGLSIRPVRTYRGYTNGIRTVTFLGNARVIGGGDSGELSVWDIAGEHRATLPSHHGRIWSIGVDLQNARIASASDDHTIRLWNAETGQCLTALSGHNNWVRAVAFGRQGRFLVSGGDDCTIRIWNTASGFCRKTLEHPNAWVRTVQFDPTNSRYIISGGDDQVVRHWDIKEKTPRTLAQHEHRICSVAYSPDGLTVASGSDDATVILCDVKSAQVIHRFANADLGIKSVAFSPNGQYLAAGGEDQLLYIWDLKDPDPAENCRVLSPLDYRGRSGGIRSVAFSPNGEYVITGGLDGMIRIGELSQLTESSQQVLKPLIARDRPYETTKIENIKGLSRLQVANLLTLGAVDKTKSLLS